MKLLDDVMDLIKHAASGKAAASDVNLAYDEAAKSVPQATLAEGIAHTFKSDQTPAFETMVSGLFGQSDPNQKAGLLNQIVGSLGPGGLTQALGAGGALAGLSGILSGGNVTPQQAQQVTPQAVAVLAQQAAKKDPSIVDRAAGFYAQHPGLVKTLGAGALAMVLSKVSSAKKLS